MHLFKSVQVTKKTPRRNPVTVDVSHLDFNTLSERLDGPSFKSIKSEKMRSKVPSYTAKVPFDIRYMFIDSSAFPDSRIEYSASGSLLTTNKLEKIRTYLSQFDKKDCITVLGRFNADEYEQLDAVNIRADADMRRELLSILTPFTYLHRMGDRAASSDIFINFLYDVEPIEDRAYQNRIPYKNAFDTILNSDVDEAVSAFFYEYIKNSSLDVLGKIKFSHRNDISDLVKNRQNSPFIDKNCDKLRSIIYNLFKITYEYLAVATEYVEQNFEGIDSLNRFLKEVLKANAFSLTSGLYRKIPVRFFIAASVDSKMVR